MLNTAQGWGIERKWRGYERYICQFQFNIVCPRYLLGDEGINKQTPGTVMSDTAYASDIFLCKRSARETNEEAGESKCLAAKLGHR